MARRSRSSSDSSRSLSPYNKRNRPPRRSRSTDRRRSNRGRRSSPRRSRSRSLRRSRDGRLSARHRSPHRFNRRSPSPRGRRRSRSRPRKSPSRRSRSPASKHKQQETKSSTSNSRRRSISPKSRFVEKPTSRERPQEARNTGPKQVVREAESTTAKYNKPPGGGDEQRSGNQPRSGSANREGGGARRQSSPERKDFASAAVGDYGRRERTRSRSPVSRVNHPSTRTQSAEGRPTGFNTKRDVPHNDRRGSYGGTPSEKNSTRTELSRDRPIRDADSHEPIRNASPPHKGHGVIRQTSTTLHERFSVAEGVSLHSTFDPPEQITIGIERNIPGNEPAIMRSEYRVEDVVVIRQKDEGLCPFYERQEFQTRPGEVEYSERRVVKIVRPTESQRAIRGGGKFEQEYQMKNFEVQTSRYKMEADSCTSERVTLSDRWGSKRDPEALSSHAVENVIHHDHDMLDTDRLPNVRPSGIGRDERMLSGQRSSGEFGEWDRFQRDPHDLRHNLVVKRRTGAPEMAESKYTVRYRFGRDDDGESHRPREVIQQGRRGSGTGGKPRLTSLVGHAEVGARSMDTRNVLPDFSKRENKYDYQAWEDHPEMIPRGSSYFEHDNRDDFNYRGRRGFGRGPFRGGGRGRGAGRRDFNSSEPAWKHDKYEEIEDDDDNKPTSTT